MPRYPIFMIILFALTTACAGGQEGEVGDEARAEDAEVVGVADAVLQIPDGVIERAMARELEILQRITKLSDESVAGLKLGLKPLLSKEKERWAKAAGSRFKTDINLSRRLLRDIRTAAEQLVADKDLLRQYQTDLETRRQFGERAAAAHFVQTVDSLVGLTTTQLPRIRRLALKLSEEGKINATMVSPASQIAVEPADVKDALTEQQLEHYKAFVSLDATAFVGSDHDAETRHETLTKHLRAVAAMKIGYLEAELNLSEQQVMKLRLASKNVLSKARTQRLEAETKYKKYVQDIQSGAGATLPDGEVIALAMASPAQLFERQERWEKFVRDTLDSAQSARWKEIQRSRNDRMREALGYALVIAFNQELQLTGQQQVRTHKLISACFGKVTSAVPNGLAMMDTYASLLDISEEDYVAAMGEDNWLVFKPQLDQLRQRVDAMSAQQPVEK